VKLEVFNEAKIEVFRAKIEVFRAKIGGLGRNIVFFMVKLGFLVWNWGEIGIFSW
jgi:hypothetical protein